MKNNPFFNKRNVALVCAAFCACSAPKTDMQSSQPAEKYIFSQAGNPYLPLWEHLPDGEPRVFEDPDNPGKYRAYIIGSHDVRFTSYCGPDIRMWSAPVDDLTSWRDEGSIFTYNIDNQWDVMYAPDLVEVIEDGKKVYYLYPHSRGPRREAMVCKGLRPDGPFTPVNITEDGKATTQGSVLGFDPSIFVEKITDTNDPDAAIGFRAYGFWGFQRSMAAQLDQKTMFSVRPGTEIIPYFIPASARYGVVRDPEGTTYPALYSEQKPGEFNFFEASSIRQVGNKYVMIFSGYSGPDYGLESTNSTLRYAYGDTPLGPWRSGGVLVDSRGVVPNKDGSQLMTTNAAHNTHGSIEQINGQWYAFYHRPPRGFGFARQAMVAPIIIECDEAKVADGGKVVIKGYNPYAPDSTWSAKASNGDHYTGAEVTSEGFHIYGLDPYQYYSAGYACFMTNGNSMHDSWDNWDNAMDMANVKNGDIIGFKYFGFGGLQTNTKGVKAFAGTAPENKTTLSLFVEPITNDEFTIKIMLDGPWANKTWNGKQIGEIKIPANAPKAVNKYTVDVANFVDNLDGKHAIYLVAEGKDGNLFTLKGLGFNSVNKQIERPVPPTVNITVGGVAVEIPNTPTFSTNQNGYTKANVYTATYKLNNSQASTVEASSNDSNVKFNISQAKGGIGTATITAEYKGQTKIFNVEISK